MIDWFETSVETRTILNYFKNNFIGSKILQELIFFLWKKCINIKNGNVNKKNEHLRSVSVIFFCFGFLLRNVVDRSDLSWSVDMDERARVGPAHLLGVEDPLRPLPASLPRPRSRRLPTEHRKNR
jgi:hypothetical protein